MGRSDQGIQASQDRWQVIPRTLCFVTNGDDVLLLRGAQDKPIWPGKYNGVGGHVERNEDVLQAARREIREETGLEVDDIHLRGIVNIDTGNGATGIALFIFTAHSATRETKDSPEGSLEWHPRQQLPQTALVDDLSVILPPILKMADDAPPFFARYWYDDRDSLHIDFTETTPEPTLPPRRK